MRKKISIIGLLCTRGKATTVKSFDLVVIVHNINKKIHSETKIHFREVKTMAT